jgi:transcriptional regulator with GAF, ATPase, and Fis domain
MDSARDRRTICAMMIENAVVESGTETFEYPDGLSVMRVRSGAERAPGVRRPIVGESPALKEVLQLVDFVAASEATVLISGETGTGKELVARAIHERSPRRHRPFVVVNCGAVPGALLASELFGHEKGAFTGALQRRIGRFEQAAGGTIFLDEIGELPMESQTALLRVLQEREFERVGGAQPIRCDVRVVVATNRRLEDEVAAGRFRADLFYRLNVVPVVMPPLRERREDLPALVRHFVERSARAAGKAVRRLSDASMARLNDHAWPGNVRELQNIVERAVILARSEVATVEARWLSPCGEAQTGISPVAVAAAPARTFAARVNAREKEMIETALRDTLGRVSGRYGAAARLSIPPSTLESKIRALGIHKSRYMRPRGEEG